MDRFTAPERVRSRIGAAADPEGERRAPDADASSTPSPFVTHEPVPAAPAPAIRDSTAMESTESESTAMAPTAIESTATEPPAITQAAPQGDRLDQIRDIMFGQELDAYEQRFAALETRLEEQAATLRASLREEMAVLRADAEERFTQTDVALLHLSTSIDRESDERSAALDELTSSVAANKAQLHTSLVAFERSLDSVAIESERSVDGLASRTRELEQLGERFATRLNESRQRAATDNRVIREELGDRMGRLEQRVTGIAEEEIGALQAQVSTMKGSSIDGAALAARLTDLAGLIRSDCNPDEARPDEAGSVEARPTDARPTEVRSTEVRPTEVRSTEH